MNEHDFAEWLTIIMAINVPPQLYAAHLFLRWRSHAQRRWVRVMFLMVAVNAFIFAVARITSTFFLDSLMIRFLTAVYFVASNYLTIGLFGLVTHVMEKRMKEERAKQPLEDQKSSDILGAVISDFRTEMKLTTRI